MYYSSLFVSLFLIYTVNVSARKTKTLVYTGSHSKDLAKSVLSELGSKIAPMTIARFSDGEIKLEMGKNLKDSNVIIIHSTRPNVNDSLLELLFMVSTAKKEGANYVTAVVPYLCYARQNDTRLNGRPTSIKVVASLLETVGLDKLVTLDIHSISSSSFFKNTQLESHLVHSTAVKYFVQLNLQNVVVVAPDTGARKRAYDFMNDYNDQFENRDESLARLALVHKYRSMSYANLALIFKYRSNTSGVHCSYLSGSRVKSRNVIIVDDIIDTGGTIIKAAALLKSYGAERIFVYATHGVFSGDAVERLNNSIFEKVLVTNSIKQPKKVLESEKIKVVDVSQYLSNLLRFNN